MHLMEITKKEEVQVSLDDFRKIIASLGHAKSFRLFIGFCERLPAREQVKFIYVLLLGRDADEGGIDTYSRFLRAGVPILQIMKMLMNSDEFNGYIDVDKSAILNREDLLAKIYIAKLRRPIDPSGRDYYSNLLESGRSIDKIVKSIDRSKEARRIRTQRITFRRELRHHLRRAALRRFLLREYVLSVPSSLMPLMTEGLQSESRRTRHYSSDTSRWEDMEKLPDRAQEILKRFEQGAG